jgi:acetyltransferase-like isoleucine patch superfamily enzyme
MINTVFRLVVAAIPYWPLKRYILCKFYGYRISPSARIGFSYIYPERLVMEQGSRIGHANVCKGLNLLRMAEYSSIGKLNWITGFPKKSATRHFVFELSRNPRLVIGRHVAITNRHLVDCTNRIIIGEYTTIAGFRSQLLTHSIELASSRQASAPIIIGKRCFLGTGVIILPGSTIASFSVVAAGAVVPKSLTQRYSLYAGVPARLIKDLAPSCKYFVRDVGYVD